MEYKEFLIGDLFDQFSNTKNKTKFEKQKEKTNIFNLPATSSSTTNNGLGYYVKKEDHNPLKNMLTVASNGNAGKMFYHTNDFAIAQDSYALKLKENDSVNVYLYIKTLMEKLIIPKYDWTLKATWNRIKKHKIKLPVKDNGNIDFEYIETFMQNIKEKYIQNLEEKTEKEINILTEKLNINIEEPIPEYKEPEQVKPFKVGDLFEVSGTKSRNRKDLEFKDSGIEFIGRTKTNNGVQGYLDLGQTKPNELGTISISQVGTVVALYRPKPYYCSQNIIKLSQKEPINEILSLYFVTTINKQLKIYGGYITPKIADIKNIILDLPVQEDGSINYQYMLETGGGYYY